MSNFSDPYILKHLEETLGTVHQGLCQARSALRSSASLSAVSGVDSSLYDCIDKALNLSAAAQQEVSDLRFAAALRYRLDSMYHRGEVINR